MSLSEIETILSGGEIVPQSRIEKIIVGEDIVPQSRIEQLLKEILGGGGGASSADVFIIHATPDETNTNAQLDKTAEQIYEAYQSGKYCLVYVRGMFLQVTSVQTDITPYMMICSGFRFSKSEQVTVVMFEFTTNNNVTWAISPLSPMLYYVRFFDPQISGPGNRMYTLSVDADGNVTATAVT